MGQTGGQFADAGQLFHLLDLFSIRCTSVISEKESSSPDCRAIRSS
jgi:hypothetical protein